MRHIIYIATSLDGYIADAQLSLSNGEAFGAHLLQDVLPARKLLAVTTALAGGVQAFGVEGVHGQQVLALRGRPYFADQVVQHQRV